ncbi:MAG: DUF5069 domain-containing protein [Chthoniobacterales bacterium]
MMNIEKVRALAADLNQTAPRSPRAALSKDFPAIAARIVDKCRADLAGLGGPYHYNCALDRKFFAATGLEASTCQATLTLAEGKSFNIASSHHCHT